MDPFLSDDRLSARCDRGVPTRSVRRRGFRPYYCPVPDVRRRSGWDSDFPTFRSAQPSVVRERLQGFVSDASIEQVRAWNDAIPSLQREVDEVLLRDALARNYSAILEYELPMEARRPDVLLLAGLGVLVVELK